MVGVLVSSTHNAVPDELQGIFDHGWPPEGLPEVMKGEVVTQVTSDRRRVP